MKGNCSLIRLNIGEREESEQDWAFDNAYATVVLPMTIYMMTIMKMMMTMTTMTQKKMMMIIIMILMMMTRRR